MHLRTTLALACSALMIAAAGCGSSDNKTTSSSAAAGGSSATKPACPNGKVNFAVEPYDSGPKFQGAYNQLASYLSTALGCPVKLIVTQNYTAEVEAMRAGKVDIGEFGPLGYVFANKLAKAVPVAAFGDKNSKPV